MMSLPSSWARWCLLSVAGAGAAAGLSVAIGCGPTSPPPLDCDTAVETRSYFLSSGCGTGGPITVTTTRGSCAVTVDGGYAAQVPSVGEFTARGPNGEFTLEGGNWLLEGSVRFAFHPPVDETLACSAGPLDADAGTQLLSCSTSICSDVGDEGSSCEEQLCTAILFDPSRVPIGTSSAGEGLGGGDDDAATAVDAGDAGQTGEPSDGGA